MLGVWDVWGVLDLGLIIEGFTALRRNISSVSDIFPVCLFPFINSCQQINVIWQLFNDVSFMNEYRQNNCGNESLAFDFFFQVLSSSSLWLDFWRVRRQNLKNLQRRGVLDIW